MQRSRASCTVACMTAARTVRCTRRGRFAAASAATLSLLFAAALAGPVHGPPVTLAQATAPGANPAMGRVFTLMGDGSHSNLVDGAIATDLDAIPDRVAAAPDGSFVVIVDGRVLRVTLDGRVHPIPTPGRSIADVTAGPDGALYLLDGRSSTILRVGPDGRLAPFAGRRQPEFECRSGGDGAPASDAQICAVRIAMSTNGLLLLEQGPRVVRHIGPDGIITRLAGNGRTGTPTDGAPAIASPLDASPEDDDIAAMPDGSPGAPDPVRHLDDRNRRADPSPPADAL